ncbi:MAG: 50S ribosomal protein L11 methyltransferase [Deltaproteobacteria bacterium]
MHRYFCLSVELSRRERDWLAERLAHFGFPSFEEQSRPGRACLMVYDPGRERLQALESALRVSAGQRQPAVVLGCSIRLAPTDWVLRWTEYLEPVQLTPSLTLYPSSAPPDPLPGALYLEPAFAFGFGEHASTRLIAAWVEARCRAQPGCSVLDVGCGTGVLALVACKSGAGRVLGVDTSEAAVLAARANAASNQLAASFTEQSAEELDERFDYVVANIEAQVLLGASDGIVRCARAARELALAGFIEEQVDELVQHYAALGIVLHQEARAGDWCLLSGC